MNKNSVIQVFFEKQLVGQLTMHGHNTAFEYDEEWLNNGFSISPFSLPLEKQICNTNVGMLLALRLCEKNEKFAHQSCEVVKPIDKSRTFAI